MYLSIGCANPLEKLPKKNPFKQTDGKKRQQLRSENGWDSSRVAQEETKVNARSLEYACNLRHLSMRFRNSFTFFEVSDVH